MIYVLLTFFPIFVTLFYFPSFKVAGGGAPGDCDFSVAGEVCAKTCDGTKPNTDPSKDPDYKSFKDLYSCIEDKCVIQLGACNDDDVCKKCCK
jgi:hypothetical protein